MTQVTATFHFESTLGEAEITALGKVRDVYGVRQLTPDDNAHTILVEYDASRLSQNDVAALLREAGIHLHEPVISRSAL